MAPIASDYIKTEFSMSGSNSFLLEMDRRVLVDGGHCKSMASLDETIKTNAHRVDGRSGIFLPF